MHHVAHAENGNRPGASPQSGRTTCVVAERCQMNLDRFWNNGACFAGKGASATPTCSLRGGGSGKSGLPGRSLGEGRSNPVGFGPALHCQNRQNNHIVFNTNILRNITTRPVPIHHRSTLNSQLSTLNFSGHEPTRADTSGHLRSPQVTSGHSQSHVRPSQTPRVQTPTHYLETVPALARSVQ